MALSVYGKHPAKGDFLEHGLPAALRAPLEQWLDAVLAAARTELGDTWAHVWRDAPLLRFWIGEAIWGMPVAGVMVASEDRVGRRFPLVMLCAGDEAQALPAPTVGGDGGWYDAVAAHLAAMRRRPDIASPADLLAGAMPPVADAAQPEAGPSDFWAVRPGAALDALFADISLTDHRRAAVGRSYWWVAGDAIDAVADVPPAIAAPADVAADDLPPAADPAPDATDDAALSPAAPPLAPEPAAWDVPARATEVDDASPFAQGSGLGLFAAPEPADLSAPAFAAPEAPLILPPAAARVLWSQVWAGAGLPGGAVLAWFLRGVSDNG